MTLAEIIVQGLFATPVGAVEVPGRQRCGEVVGCKSNPPYGEGNFAVRLTVLTVRP